MMNFNKIIFVSLLAVLFFSFIITSTASAKTTTFNATVTADLLYIRSGPGKNYSNIGQLAKGAIVKVYEQKGDWSRVGAGKKWVKNEYLKKTAVATAGSRATKTPAKTVAAASSTVPATTTVAKNITTGCLQAIKEANAYCSSIAKGCSSFSVTPKCLDANKKCEERQNIALESCSQ